MSISKKIFFKYISVYDILILFKVNTYTYNDINIFAEIDTTTAFIFKLIPKSMTPNDLQPEPDSASASEFMFT